MLFQFHAGHHLPSRRNWLAPARNGSDLELIVWARNNLPNLLDRFERLQSDLRRLMNDLHETAEGLGSWHDGTEYLEWAEKEVRHIWMRSKGLDSRGKPLGG